MTERNLIVAFKKNVKILVSELISLFNHGI